MGQDRSRSDRSSPDDFLGFTIVRLAHVLQRRMDDALKQEVGISVRQFGALSYIARDAGIGSAELGRRLLITAQSAGPLVDELANRGYLVRDAAPAGVRKAIRLTPLGLSALQQGYGVAERLRAEDEADLTLEEARLINTSLHALLDRLTREPSLSPAKGNA